MDLDKIISKLDDRLREIEKSVSGINSKLDNLVGWMESRDRECQELEKDIQALGIANAKHGVYVTLISICISAFLTASMTYYFNKKLKDKEITYHVESKK